MNEYNTIQCLFIFRREKKGLFDHEIYMIPWEFYFITFVAYFIRFFFQNWISKFLPSFCLFIFTSMIHQWWRQIWWVFLFFTLSDFLSKESSFDETPRVNGELFSGLKKSRKCKFFEILDLTI